MAETDITSTVSSNLDSVQQDFQVDSESTEQYGNQNETYYDQVYWTKWFGYYRQVPEYSALIDAKATWTVGKGFIADPQTSFILNSLKGWGKDTFNTILENLIRTYHIGGDSFAEIIRDEDGQLINLKPLDPETMRIVVNNKGMIKRYEQMGKTPKDVKKFQPNEIFHLARNRVADEIHGESMTEKVEWTLMALMEVKKDMKILMHRHVKPMRIWSLDTDDPTEIASFKSTIDKAHDNTENIYVPKGIVEQEVATVAPNATLNPLPWIAELRTELYQQARVPQIIVGGSSEFTEASAKIAYLAFQQNIEEEQLYVEEQTAYQLGLTIELDFPASLENEVLSDQKKDGNSAFQQNDTTAGVGQ